MTHTWYILFDVPSHHQKSCFQWSGTQSTLFLMYLFHTKHIEHIFFCELYQHQMCLIRICALNYVHRFSISKTRQFLNSFNFALQKINLQGHRFKLWPRSRLMFLFKERQSFNSRNFALQKINLQGHRVKLWPRSRLIFLFKERHLFNSLSQLYFAENQLTGAQIQTLTEIHIDISF